MTQETGHCRHVSAIGNQEARVAVTEGVHVQLSSNPFFFRIILNLQVKVLGVIGSWLSCLRNKKSSSVSLRFS